MKPGMSQNISDPVVGQDQALRNVGSVGSGSRQTSDTTQTASMDPNRLAPRARTTERAGTAEVERDEIMPNQTSDYSRSQGTIDAKRRNMFRKTV
jgi:hypothetical protein